MKLYNQILLDSSSLSYLGRTYDLIDLLKNNNSLSLGKNPTNDIILNGDFLLPAHAVITRQNNSYTIQGLSDAHPCLVEGALVTKTQAQTLRNGKILIGDAELTYQSTFKKEWTAWAKGLVFGFVVLLSLLIGQQVWECQQYNSLLSQTNIQPIENRIKMVERLNQNKKKIFLSFMIESDSSFTKTILTYYENAYNNCTDKNYDCRLDIMDVLLSLNPSDEGFKQRKNFLEIEQAIVSQNYTRAFALFNALKMSEHNDTFAKYINVCRALETYPNTLSKGDTMRSIQILESCLSTVGYHSQFAQLHLYLSQELYGLYNQKNKTLFEAKSYEEFIHNNELLISQLPTLKLRPWDYFRIAYAYNNLQMPDFKKATLFIDKALSRLYELKSQDDKSESFASFFNFKCSLLSRQSLFREALTNIQKALEYDSNNLIFKENLRKLMILSHN